MAVHNAWRNPSGVSALFLFFLSAPLFIGVFFVQLSSGPALELGEVPLSLFVILFGLVLVLLLRWSNRIHSFRNVRYAVRQNWLSKIRSSILDACHSHLSHFYFVDFERCDSYFSLFPVFLWRDWYFDSNLQYVNLGAKTLTITSSLDLLVGITRIFSFLVLNLLIIGY